MNNLRYACFGISTKKLSVTQDQHLINSLQKEGNSKIKSKRCQERKRNKQQAWKCIESNE